MKRNDGITLIALVITIIILLILAGVSISAVLGENGIITKSKNSKAVTEEAEKKEKEELENAGKYIDEQENGVEAKAEAFEKLISVDNYGEKTNYSVNGIDDWRIFYENDDGRIFLIAADYMPVEKVEDKMKMQTFGKYQYFWTNIPEFQEATQLELFMANGYTLNSSYRNSMCASVLLNTENWTSFVDEKFADYAIGSPTIEMWIASWNENYNDTFTLTTGKRGYILNGGDFGLGYGEAEANCESSGYGTIYFPHTHSGDLLSGENIGYEGCHGYWLASPQDGTIYE